MDNRWYKLRFPIVALFFLCISFIFFIIWLVSTFVLDTFYNTLSPMGSSLGTNANASFQSNISSISMAFGVICCIFFIVGILLIFILDSWSDEPEQYYRN